ncbi:MAG: aldehyde dehydrogenase family protein [Vicingaceae bacterium]
MANRIEVLKTYKLYINGKFPRTESGRYYVAKGAKGDELGNICLASRKDFRNAVVAARKAQSSWAGRSAFNRGQILYRIAEHMESRQAEFAMLLVKEEGLTENKAKEKVALLIDRIIYFAGWTDKFQQLFSSVNPVASSHFNFSILEPVGLVSVLCDQEAGFEGFVSSILSAISSGNSVVILASENSPSSAITFAEVLQHSDMPSGVVNILTGKVDELAPHFTKHMDVNALLYLGKDENLVQQLQLEGVENLKRIRYWKASEFSTKFFASPYRIKEFLEVKTTWHPIEQIGGAAPAY